MRSLVEGAPRHRFGVAPELTWQPLPYDLPGRFSTQLVVTEIEELYAILGWQNLVKARSLIPYFAHYPVYLADGKVDEPEGLRNLFTYVTQRLPEEALINRHVKMVLVTDPQFFLARSDRKVMSARNRWYRVEREKPESPDAEDKTVIYMHVRGSTDVHEIITHAAILELVKQNARDSAFPLPGYSDGALNNWLHGQIEICRAPGSLPLDWLKIRMPTATHLSEQVKKFLAEQALPEPEGIIFSNDYSLRLLLSSYLLNEDSNQENGSTYRDYLISLAQTAFETFRKKPGKKSALDMTGLELLGQTLHTYRGSKYVGRPDLTTFLIDQALLYYVVQNADGSDKVVTDLAGKVNSAENEARLGILTAISQAASPTAEPVKYVNFGNIEYEVIKAIPALIRDQIIRLRRYGLRALMMPYMPGDLSYQIIKKLKKEFPFMRFVCEMGKVGHVIAPQAIDINGDDRQTVHHQIHLGSRVVPTMFADTYGVNGLNLYPIANHVKKRHVTFFSLNPALGYTEATGVEAPSVALQAIGDYDHVFDQTRTHLIFVNMEMAHIAKAVNEDDLSLFEVDYISDEVSVEVRRDKKKWHKISHHKRPNRLRSGVVTAQASLLLALADYFSPGDDTLNSLPYRGDIRSKKGTPEGRRRKRGHY